MKILRFSAENIKGLKVLEISPTGDVVTISGKNGAGKTSVLDSIEATLCGGDLPLSKGAEKGKVEIDLGDCTVTRVITDKTDRLIVKNKDGATYPSPRDFLSKFIGHLSIDPLSFIRLDEDEQLEVLFNMAPGLKDALSTAEAKIEALRLDRTQINKDKARAAIAIEAMPEYPEAPEFPVSVLELAQKLTAAHEKERNIEAFKVETEKTTRYLNEAIKEITEIDKKIAVLIKEKEEKTILAGQCKEKIAGLNETAKKLSSETVNAAGLVEQINQAESLNKKIAANENKAARVAEHSALMETYTAKGQELKSAEETKAALLSNTKLPLPGISVEAGQVTYKGIPISQLSTGEKVRVGASLAVSQNPQAKIILADDVSLLDTDNLKILYDTCKGYQLWVVINDESGSKGFFIEAGEIKK